MQTFTAAVLGATGLIGELLVQQLLDDTAFSKVRILVRRAVKLSHPKLEVQIVDFENLPEFRNELGTGDCIFSCVGTTQKKVKGDKTAYRKVDFDIPVNAAKMGRDAGFRKYLLVSSVGANAASGTFYLRLKGEIEKEIAALKYESFHAFRPGMLYGDRKEFRLGEKIGKVAMKGISLLLAGNLKKYRGIEAADVATAMRIAAKTDKKGMFVHHYEDMMKAGTVL